MAPVSPSVVIPENVATASVSHELQSKETSVSKDKTNFKDDDDFFLLYQHSVRGCTLKKEIIAQLSNDYPGIFDGLYNPHALLDAHPIKYQPLAKLISNTCDINSILHSDSGYPGWGAEHMTYGMYEGGFWNCEIGSNGSFLIRVHEDHYQLTKETNLFVAQLREFLFDESQADEDKLCSLKMLFPPLQVGEKNITFQQLRENMDFLFGVEFKMAQQRAIGKGLKP